MTDSFDSQAGGYRQTRQSSFGNVWSFGSTDLFGSGSIGGDCRSFEKLTVGGDYEIVSSSRSLEARFEMPSLQPPVTAIPLTVPRGATVRIGTGVYRLSQLILEGGTRLICDSKIEVYANDVRIEPGTLINLSDDPMALRLFVRANAAVSTPFSGIVDAPLATVTITGSGDWFGAIVGRVVTIDSGSSFHFDRSLPYRSRGALMAWRLHGWPTQNDRRRLP